MFSEAELCGALKAAEQKVPYLSSWRHIKTGNCYEVRCLALDEADPTKVLVVYERATYPLVWVRSLAEFTDGRFERIA